LKHRDPILVKIIVCLMSLGLLLADEVMAEASNIAEIRVRGNAKVEADAIIAIMDVREGDMLDRTQIREDIKRLFELGYFSDVRVFSERIETGLRLIVEVAEKPAITAIKFEGFSEVSEGDLTDKLQTRLYTIVNEATIAGDLRIIEREYTNKGFYLATASYRLDEINQQEVELTYVMEEGGKVRVGSVYILGNEHFSDIQLLDRLVSKPVTRASSFSAMGSMFQDDFVRYDVEMLSMYYREFGFARVQVARPVIELDSDRRFVRITHEVEEGLQYSIGSLDITGDLLIDKDELLEAMRLEPGELFRYSRFRADVDMLIDRYGDLGYAFVDVNPIPTFDDENQTVDLRYHITKGEKVYFGKMLVTGNDKTRDNVVRRELEVAEGELYSGTGLRRSRRNVERLGYFEEVQAIRERDASQSNILNYRFRVREKPTGQLQAALGFSPGQSSAESNWFGQGRYSEDNQSGKGWRTSLAGRWNGGRNYSLDAGFTDPRVNDTYWSLGFNAFLSNTVREVTEGVDLQERRVGGSVTVGRRLFELVRGSITYEYSRITQETDTFLLDQFREEGVASSVSVGLRRNSTNNLLDPSEGSDFSLRQKFSGGIFGGDRQYLETTAEASYYYPIDFTDTYRTYFRLHGNIGYIYPYGDTPVPFFERYRLGGPNDLRGYRFRSIGPKYNILRAPGRPASEINKGGDKQIHFQFEYFVPLIPEAGIKGLLFSDAGQVFDDSESINLDNLLYNVGFGFRWITPVAPFRFEWAYPIEDGQLGALEFIFYLGY